MIDSGVGRSDLAEVGQRRREPRRDTKADDRDVRQPGPLLALVHARAAPAARRDPPRARPPAVLVVEHEHPDAARLAVARRLGATGRRAAAAASRRAAPIAVSSPAGRQPRNASVTWRFSARHEAERLRPAAPGCHATSRSTVSSGSRRAQKSRAFASPGTLAGELTRLRAGSVSEDAARGGARRRRSAAGSTPGRSGR